MQRLFHPKDNALPESAGPFVLSLHCIPDQVPHWDLMLKMGDVLWTWRCVPLPFPYLGLHGTRAVRIQNHRTAYLHYEGPVRAGRLGRISIICSGAWSPYRETGLEEMQIRLLPHATADPFSALEGSWSLPAHPGEEGWWKPIPT